MYDPTLQKWGMDSKCEPKHFVAILSRSIHIMPGLKADWQHPRNYPPTPTDYRHTDNHLRMEMVVVALCCTWHSRAPNIDRCVPEI